MPACQLFRIDVQPQPLTIGKGQSIQLNALGYDIGNNIQHGTTFTWTSSDTSIATVTATGVVTAIKKGQCDIVATSGSTTGSSQIRVN